MTEATLHVERSQVKREHIVDRHHQVLCEALQVRKKCERLCQIALIGSGIAWRQLLLWQWQWLIVQDYLPGQEHSVSYTVRSYGSRWLCCAVILHIIHRCKALLGVVCTLSSCVPVQLGLVRVCSMCCWGRTLLIVLCGV